MLKLPIYTDEILNIGQFYTTIDVSGGYYPVGSDVQLVNNSNRVSALGYITKTEVKKFDFLVWNDLKHSPSQDLYYWDSAYNFFAIKFGDNFHYYGDIQLVTFVVTGNIKQDTLLEETYSDEAELGLPDDIMLGIGD